jgi:hypothetical protein
MEEPEVCALDSGSIALVRLHHTLNGSEVLSTFGLVIGGTLTTPEIAADVQTALIPTWMNGRSSDIVFNQVSVVDDVPGVEATGFSPIIPTPGDGGPGAAPPNCAVLVKWSSLFKGKGGRGRIYLAGFPSTTAASGFWTSDAQDPASAAASAIFDAYGPAGSNLAVGALSIINRQLGGVALVPHTATPVNLFSIDNIIRSMRTREVGKGS